MALRRDVHAIATDLHAQAGRYRSLASAAADDRVIRLCLDLARGLEDRAHQLECEILERIPADKRHAA